jgi:hypothetical protein
MDIDLHLLRPDQHGDWTGFEPGTCQWDFLISDSNTYDEDNTVVVRDRSFFAIPASLTSFVARPTTLYVFIGCDFTTVSFMVNCGVVAGEREVVTATGPGSLLEVGKCS